MNFCVFYMHSGRTNGKKKEDFLFNHLCWVTYPVGLLGNFKHPTLQRMGGAGHLSLAMINSLHLSWIFLALWNHIKHMMTVFWLRLQILVRWSVSFVLLSVTLSKNIIASFLMHESLVCNRWLWLEMQAILLQMLWSTDTVSPLQWGMPESGDFAGSQI